MIEVGDCVTLKKPWGDVQVTEVGRVWVGFRTVDPVEFQAWHGDSPPPMRIKRKHWAANPWVWVLRYSLTEAP